MQWLGSNRGGGQGLLAIVAIISIAVATYFIVKHTKQKDEGAYRRAETRKQRIECGEINPAIARQIALDEGDLKEKYLHELNESDLTTEDTEITPEDES